MLEIIAVLVVGVAAGLAILVLTSVFLAYATQANYVDENYDDHDD
jgi:hypothetical protein